MDQIERIVGAHAIAKMREEIEPGAAVVRRAGAARNPGQHPVVDGCDDAGARRFDSPDERTWDSRRCSSALRFYDSFECRTRPFCHQQVLRARARDPHVGAFGQANGGHRAARQADFARTKPRGIVDDVHNGARATPLAEISTRPGPRNSCTGTAVQCADR